MTLSYENKKIKEGYQTIIGCDEVGRGCLAGPVVAAAVVLPSLGTLYKASGIEEIRDSKQLSAVKREALSEIIKKYFLWSIAEVSSKEVDEINIHNASLLAMKKAVEGLPLGVIPSECIRAEESLKLIYPSKVKGSLRSSSDAFRVGRDDTGKAFLFVDGKFKVPNLNIEQEAVIGGDNKVLSIAAASIIAKVYRDELMQKFDKQYPKYNLAKHKGYATEYHRKMVIEYGTSPIHRLTFCGNLV